MQRVHANGSGKTYDGATKWWHQGSLYMGSKLHVPLTLSKSNYHQHRFPSRSYTATYSRTWLESIGLLCQPRKNLVWRSRKSNMKKWNSRKCLSLTCSPVCLWAHCHLHIKLAYLSVSIISRHHRSATLDRWSQGHSKTRSQDKAALVIIIHVAIMHTHTSLLCLHSHFWTSHW